MKDFILRHKALYRIAIALRGFYYRTLGPRRLEDAARKQPLKIVVGASGIHDPGWIPTEIEYLNLMKPEHWSRFFKPDSIDAILAEHVWEYLAKEEASFAAKICFRYLKPNGYLRVAVPDGFHPDPRYIEWVRVGGIGPGADDHKILYTYKSLGAIFEAVGFKVVLCEYFDESEVPLQ